MPMNLPTLADLQATHGYGDPSVYTQHAANQGLAQLYAQQEVEQARNKTQEGFLKNQFDEQQNPQLLEQRGLENIGLQNKNVTEGVASRISAATEGMQLNQKQREFAIKASENDLKQAEMAAQQEMYSGVPQRMEEAKKILDFTSAARAERAKEEAAMARQKEQTRSHLGGIGMQVQGQKDLRKMDIAAGKYSKNTQVTQGIEGIKAAFAKGRMTAQNAAVSLRWAAVFEADPELQQKYEALALEFEQMDKNRINAAAEGKVNQGAVTGLPTRTIPSAFGAPSQPSPMTAQDQAALTWANANPNDPRAAKIKQKLGK